MSNELALPTQPQVFTVADMQVMARSVAASRLFPGIENEQSALCLMLLCQSEGLHPMQALRRFHIIKGRPSMRADAMQAEFQRRGGLIRWGRTDAEVCEARFVHPVLAPDPGVSVAFTMEDARLAGLAGNDSYRKYPRQMLRARVISEGVRMVDPGVVVGIYTPEEVDAFPDAAAVEATPSNGHSRSRLVNVPATIHVEQPGPDLDSRSAVNTAFAPGVREESDEPRVHPKSKETIPLWDDRIGARGLDVRKWADVQDGVVKVVRDRIDRYRVDEMGLSPLGDKDEPNPWSVLNHMVTATVAANAEDPNPNPAGPDGKRKAIGNGKKAEHLHRLYGSEAWREWMRAEAREYLGHKLEQAKAAARAEAGFADDPGPEPEDASQEPPEGQAEGGEWAPGRE